jgi:hypothetical protein
MITRLYFGGQTVCQTASIWPPEHASTGSLIEGVSCPFVVQVHVEVWVAISSWQSKR